MKIKKIEPFSVFDLEGSLDDAISFLENLKSECGGESTVEVDTYDTFPHFYIEYEAGETDAEKRKRLKEEERQKKAQENQKKKKKEKELKELARLKKKYE